MANPRYNAPYGERDAGGRFFGETKGLPLKKEPGTEAWVGNGLFGGLPMQVEIVAHEAGKKVTITCPMFPMLKATDLLTKIGVQWVGENVYVKVGSDGTKWLNMKTNKSLLGEADAEW